MTVTVQYLCNGLDGHPDERLQKFESFHIISHQVKIYSKFYSLFTSELARKIITYIEQSLLTSQVARKNIFHCFLSSSKVSKNNS